VSKTLYVGNLPWSITRDELAEVFDPYTEVEDVRIIIDHKTGRSRGFGFVEIPEEDVERVIEMIKGTKLKGRELVVNEAKPRSPRY